MSMGLTLLVVLFLILLLFLGAPTYLCLLTSALAYFVFNPQITSMVIMQKMYSSLDNFVLLAIPMFMLAGNIMNSGGVTVRIFDFAKKCVGHWRAGLAHVNVVASFIFSGMSGSALADVGGLGQIEMEAMRQENYDEGMILGVTAASATMGPIVPPSIPMVIYGAVASVSVGGLFMGGLVPGILTMVVLCGMIWIIGRKRNYPREARSSWKDRWISFKRSFLSLLMPFIIMGGIWTGKFTPTEAAMISIWYVLVIILVVYRAMGVKRLVEILFESVEGLVPSLCIIAGSTLFGWALQFEHFDTVLLNGFLSLTDNKYIILLLLNVLLLFAGMFLDATPVIMLFVPMLLPLSTAIGVHPIQMGVIVVLNLMIGLMPPPIGQSLFVMSTVTDLPFEKVIKCTTPWLIPLIITMLLVTYVPGITLALPKLLGII